MNNTIKLILVTMVNALGVWVVWFWWLCYLNWEILNPIQALIDTPTITETERFGNILILAFTIGVAFGAAKLLQTVKGRS